MQAGLHFNETFAPVPQISTFRTLLAVATQEDWEVKAGDVNTAFLEPRIDTLIWVKVPNYFNAKPSLSDSGFSFHQVLAGIPGIPQGPRLWYRRISPILSQCGLTQCRAEHTLYFDKLNKLYLLVWVDDLFFFFPTQAETQALKVWCKLQKDLDLDNWADISDCLGCKIVRDRPNRRMFLSQQDHAQKVLLKSCMSDSKHVDTPLASGAVLTQADSPDKSAHVTLEGERKWYLGILVSLLYLVAWTRPDLAYAVSKLCRFMHNPGQVHLTHLKRVLRYLKGTVHWGLKFDFSSTDYKSGVYGYFDAAHADCPDTRRTTMAYVFFLAGCPVSWHTKFHSFITTSTNHSEYCAAAKAAKEAKWFFNLLTSIGLSGQVNPIDLFSDSRGAIALAYNPVQRAASKHIDLADHYVRECLQQGIISVSFVRTDDMIADTLTKQLGKAGFLKHRAAMMANLDEVLSGGRVKA